MALASWAGRPNVSTAGFPSWELYATASVSPLLLELYVLTTSSVTAIGFGRAVKIGVPSSTSLFQRDEPGAPACVTAAAIAFNTQAAQPNVFARRLTTTGIGGAIWTFPRGLRIPLNGSVVMWNIQASGQIDLHAVIDE